MNAPDRYIHDEVAQLRVPPQSIEAETSLLGGLLLENGRWDVVGDIVQEGDFYRYEHRLIFRSIAALMNACKPADTITVWEWLEGFNLGAEAGGLEYLNDLSQYVPSAANMRRYAEIVRERSILRKLVSVSDEIATLAFNPQGKKVPEILDEAQQRVFAIGDQEAPRDEWVTAADGMVQHTQVLEERNDGNGLAWATGLTDLDAVLEGGFRPGELIVLGARPSMGKTALAMSIGVIQAESVPVGMLSMEMPQRDLNDRLTAILGRVTLSAVKRPRKEGLQWDRVMEGIEKAKALQWFSSDKSGLTINAVRTKARQLKRRHGLSVLIVDYIGLMSGTDSKLSRVYQLEEISRGLKSLAKELDIAVLCLAQVNRKVEERADQSPSLADLRDSGAIEQDADVVMFLHRPVQSNPKLTGEWQHYAKLTVAKNRQGRSGVLVDLFYAGEQTRFSSWSGPRPVVQTVSSNTRSRGMKDEQ